MARVYEAGEAGGRGVAARLRGGGVAAALVGLAGMLGACAGTPEPLRGPGESVERAGAAGGAGVSEVTRRGRVLTPEMLYAPGEVVLREVGKGGPESWALERRTTGVPGADGGWTLQFERREAEGGEGGVWEMVRELGLRRGAAGGVEMVTLRDAERGTMLTFVPPIEILPARLEPGATAKSAAKVESVEVGEDGRARGSVSRGEATHVVERVEGGAREEGNGLDAVLATLRLELRGAVVTRERRSSYGAAGLVHERERLTVKVGPFTMEKREREVEKQALGTGH
jgi:hypothetical protein